MNRLNSSHCWLLDRGTNQTFQKCDDISIIRTHALIQLPSTHTHIHTRKCHSASRTLVSYCLVVRCIHSSSLLCDCCCADKSIHKSLWFRQKDKVHAAGTHKMHSHQLHRATAAAGSIWSILSPTLSANQPQTLPHKHALTQYSCI